MKNMNKKLKRILIVIGIVIAVINGWRGNCNIYDDSKN